MRRSRPLPDSYPEFSILEYPGSREYRVENWRLARDGSRAARKASYLRWRDVITVTLLSLIWPGSPGSSLLSAGLTLLSVILLWLKCTQVLFESVIIFDHLGVQFETHRGFPPIPLIVSRRFIPAATLGDFVINEGLRRWDVRYYLAAVTKSGSTLEVAYESMLPRFPVLLEVYRGVQETFFDPLQQNETTDNLL